MKPSARLLAALHHQEADRVPTGEDQVDGKLVEEILQRPSLSPIMGVERFHQFILPGLRRQCEAIHDRGGYFIKHTDGNTWDILDSFVDIGIDGWHGIQPCIGMDFRLLKERYGGQLCFFGGVNCETLIEEKPAAVYEEVRYAIAIVLSRSQRARVRHGVKDGL